MVSSKWAKPPGSVGGLGRIAEDAHDAEVARVGDEKVMHVDIRIGKRATQARQAALLVLDENGELFDHNCAPLVSSAASLRANR